MFDAFRADPCRFLEALLDARQLRRIWRAWRTRGIGALLDELSLPDDPGIKAHRDATVPPAAERPDLQAVLVIDAHVPLHDRDAGSRASYLYLLLLRKLGHPVYFLPNDQLPRQPYTGNLEALGIEVLIGRPFRCGHWKSWLAARKDRVSHVILHRPNVAQRYLDALSEMGGPRLLYFAHDLRSLREMRHYELTGDNYHLSEARYWDGVERAILSRVSRAYFFSAEETAKAAEWTGRDVARTVPLFPLDRLPISDAPYSGRSGLLFVGGFGHVPNRDAALWFAREIFPRVRQALPDIVWHVVGREPPDEILALAGNGIVVEGAVSDAGLAALYGSIRLVVAPLRFGAGIKGKVIEALCHGVPVVTTPAGAEGIADSTELFEITDSAAAMAERIVALYSEPLRWMTAQARARHGADRLLSQQAALQVLRDDLLSSRVERSNSARTVSN